MTEMPAWTPKGTFAVLDFETSGLSPQQGDRAIEIGISLYSGGNSIDRFSSLINPGFLINSFITNLTGINNAMLASAPPAHCVMRDALAFVGDAQLVAHNASFDCKFWRHELEQVLDRVDERPFLCTLLLSRRVFQSFSSHKLGAIAANLGIPTPNSHRALADAEVTAQVLGTLIQRLAAAFPNELINADFLAQYQRRSRQTLPDLSTRKQSVNV